LEGGAQDGGGQLLAALERILLRRVGAQDAQHAAAGQQAGLFHHLQVGLEVEAAFAQPGVEVRRLQPAAAFQRRGRWRRGGAGRHGGLDPGESAAGHGVDPHLEATRDRLQAGGEFRHQRPVHLLALGEGGNGQRPLQAGDAGQRRHRLDGHTGQHGRRAVPLQDEIQQFAQMDGGGKAQAGQVGAVGADKGMQLELASQRMHDRGRVGEFRIPAAHPLEGIGRQRQPSAMTALVQALPVDGGTRCPGDGDPLQIARPNGVLQSGGVRVVVQDRAGVAPPGAGARLGDEGAQALRRRLAIGNHQRQPARQLVFAHLQGIGEIVQILAGMLLHMVEEAAHQGSERHLAHGREHQQLRLRRGRRARRGDVFLDDDVRVHAAGADRGHPGPARDLGARLVAQAMPRRQFALHIEGRLLEGDVGVQGLGVQRGGQLAVRHLHQHLGDAGQARGSQQVGDVALDRADRAALDGVGVPAEGLGQRLDLDGIAERGARAVPFHIADGAGIDPGILQRPLDGDRLLAGIGHREAVAHAGVADRRAADDAVDVVAVALGVGQGLQHQRADAFAQDGAVSPQPVAADHLGRLGGEMLLRGGDQLLRVQKQADASGQRHLAAPGPEHVHRLVDAGGGRRAHGVEEIGRPGEAVEIGHHVGHGAGIAAAGQRAAHQHVLEAVEVVLVGHRADDDGHLAAIMRLEGLARIAGILEGLYGGFQNQPDLGGHQLGFVLGNAEIARIEGGDVVEEGPGAHHRLAQHVAFRMQQGVVVPAVGRIGLEAVQTVGQHVPEGLRVGRLGDPQRQADDRDVMTVAPVGGLFAPDLGGGRPQRLGRHRGRRGRAGLGQRLGQGWAVILGQMGGDAGEVDVFEEERLGERPQRLFQPVGGLDDGDGIEAVFLQLAVDADLFGLQVQDVGQDGPHEMLGANGQPGIGDGFGGFGAVVGGGRNRPECGATARRRRCAR